jgi:hypothetical protein
VLSSQNNLPISGAVVSVNGTNNTAPVNFGVIPVGTVLEVTVIASGFISESRIVTVSNLAGNLRQQVTFNLSPVLVKQNILYFAQKGHFIPRCVLILDNFDSDQSIF